MQLLKNSVRAYNDDLHEDHMTTLQLLDFKYDMNIVEDGRYGHLSLENGEWDGLIGAVRSGRATIGAAPITITKER